MRIIASTIVIIVLTIFSFYVSFAVNCTYKHPPKGIERHFMVDNKGRAGFTSLQEAIDHVPSGNSVWTRIIIKPGIYIGNVTIPLDKKCIFIDGLNPKLVTINYNAELTPATLATFSVLADNIVVRGITFQNAYNRPWWPDERGVAQAAAAEVFGDKVIFINCSFLGVQDTLWDAKGRHYYYNCYIEGVIDYIYGYGQSIYKGCMMNTTIRRPPYYLRMAYVTAQGRQSSNDPSGFVFDGGEIQGRGGQIYLGRAWGPYSRVIFKRTFMSAAVAGPGWDAWNYKGNKSNFIYSEFKCKGEGANQSKRVPWRKTLTEDELQQYSRDSFIDQDGWFAQHPLTDKIN